jgi:ABC-type lipoprotein export system ATPase subunit
MTDILKLEKVSKVVGEGDRSIHILRGISLTLRAGEYVAVMGPSGSGKSTLLHIAGLLDTPSQGKVEFLGQDVSALNDDRLASLRAHSIGFVFQTFNLLPYLTAQQNVALPMEYNHGGKGRDRSDQLLAQVGLKQRGEAYPPVLSGGERQRVAIARALANQPALLLADEPTGALDSVTGKQILQLMSELHHRGSTILLVTHDEAVARRAERILTMRDGQFE